MKLAQGQSLRVIRHVAACAWLILLLTPAVWAEPSLSPLAFLPGDAAIAPAAGTQDLPDIAAGGGGYLAVWVDERSSLIPLGTITSGPVGVPGLGTMMDIYAARLDAGGNLIDTTPIVVTQAIMNQGFPRVAWNGVSWLVVWMAQRGIQCCADMDILAARISPDGVLLDPDPIVIDETQSMDGLYWPCVGSDRTNWAVVWRDLDQAAGIYTLDGARVAPDGTVVDLGGKSLRHDVTNSYPIGPEIAYAGDEYLLVWNEDSDSIMAQRLTPALDPIGGAFRLNLYAPTSGHFPRLASDGTNFFVAWFEDRYYGWAQLFGTRVSHSGQVLDPQGIALTDFSAYTQFEPAVAWDGTNWVVAYNLSQIATERVYATRVSPAGAVLDPNGILIDAVSTWARVPSIAGTTVGGVQVVWMTETGNVFESMDVYTARMEENGTVSPRICAALGPPRQTNPHFVSHPGGYLAVYRSEISGEARILAQRLATNGTVLDLEPIVLASGSSFLLNPSAAWNGSVFLVVWENAYESKVYMRRLGADGVPIDPAPIFLMPGNTPDVAALGDIFLVVDTHAQNAHFRYPKAVRVRGTDGAVLGTPAFIGSYFSTSPSVATLGNRWFVAWQQNPTHDDPRADLYANFIAANGTPLGDFSLTQTMIASEEAPWVASKGDVAFVVWNDNRTGGTTNENLFARRVLADGTLLDPAGIQLTNAPNNQIVPVAAWDGLELVVASTDYRNQSTLEQPIGDLYGTRLDANGVLLDPNGFAIASDPVIAELDAAVASAVSGQALLGGAIFRPEGTAAYRIGIRFMNGAAAIDPASPAPALPAFLTVTPNPSAGEVRLDFDVATAGSVRAAVYSAAGRELNFFHEGAMERGPATLRWDGCDRSGRPVPHGAYYVRVEAAGRVLVAKLVRR